MTMMFEVDNLEEASPATVSRCGMIYMEPEALGLRPIIDRWFKLLPPSFSLRPKTTKPMLETFFVKYFDPSLKFVRKNCVEPVKTPFNNILESCLRILNCYFVPFIDTELKVVNAEEMEALEQYIEALFIFSVVWSVGCTTNAEGRAKFNTFFRDLMGKDNKFKFPTKGEVYDYLFHAENKEW